MFSQSNRSMVSYRTYLPTFRHRLGQHAASKQGKRRRSVVFLTVAPCFSLFCVWLFLWTSWSTNNKLIRTTQEVIWTWNRYHEKNSSIAHTISLSPQHDFLIGHYAGFQPNGGANNVDSYGTMMEESIKSSRAYCLRWMCDVLSVRGVLLNDHPTYNKLGILEAALRSGYGHVLILDSDSVLVNHSIRITDLLPRDKMLLAARVSPMAHDWNINIGVTLWNLRHPRLPWLLRLWKWRCQCRYYTFRSDNDQRPLQFLLKGWKSFRDSVVSSNDKYFYYDQGQVAKHFVRSNDKAWGAPSVDRIHKIQEQVKLVCHNNIYC